MKKLILIILVQSSFASAVNEVLLVSAKGAGELVYNSCILNPPVTDAQKESCNSIYSKYVEILQLVNTSSPLLISKTPSAYGWSPYDICRFEVGGLVFSKQNQIPYCQTLPINM